MVKGTSAHKAKQTVSTDMLFGSDPPSPISSVIPSHPLDKLRGECEIVVSDFLDAKSDPIMHQPAIALQTIPLLTSVPQVYIHVRKLTHPHHAWGGYTNQS